ncbi:MAG: hypothetical protein IPK05_19305 [Comamonadaceae bacterium]|nr:hypothetical protein [Comamonadaceae bacterium]
MNRRRYYPLAFALLAGAAAGSFRYVANSACYRTDGSCDGAAAGFVLLYAQHLQENTRLFVDPIPAIQ